MFKKRLKKIACIVLSTALAVTGAGTGLFGNTAQVFAESKNILDNPSFATDTSGWYVTGGGADNLVYTADGKGHDGDGYVKVTGRTDTWNSLTQNITGKVENGTEYDFSCWVKLGDEYTAESTVKAGLTTQSAGDNGGNEEYDGWGISGNTVTASKGKWTQISGSFKANWTGDLQKVEFKVADESVAKEACANSFYVDDLSITKHADQVIPPAGDAGQVTPPAAGTNILDNPSFGTDASGWFATTADTAKLEFVNDGKGHDAGSGYVKVTGRSDTWNSLAQTIKDKVKNRTKYDFSCWVKLGDEYTAESTVKAGLTIRSTGDNDGKDSYDGWDLSGNAITASKEEWRQIHGSFTANWTGNLEELQFKVADETCKNSFFVDDLSITEHTGQANPPAGNPGQITPPAGNPGQVTPPAGNPSQTTPPADGTNILDNPSFAANTDGWFATTGDNSAKLEFVNDGKGHDMTGGYVKVIGRSDTWNSLAQTIKDKVKNKTKYNFSCWVKLSDEYTAESTVKVGLTIQSTGDSNGEPVYDGWGISGNTVTASKDEWRQISGSFTANWTGDLTELQFKVADETCKNSFYVDELSVTENNADLSIEKDIPSLKDYFAGKNPKYDFKVGGALTADILSNDNKMQLVKKHYNSVTAGNEMKPDYIIKGINSDGSLKLDFTVPDTTLDYFWKYNQGKDAKDQIHIRGHVLCWHSQTPEVFFKDKDGKLLGKEEMNKRLEEYIQKVLAHVQEKYPGLVYCWDVVNEAINPADGEQGGLRTANNGVETFYHQIYGSSNEYIINAFKYANKYADKSVKLFYNDFGETEPEKVKCISNLADAIKAVEGTRIDGIGMQSHYSVESPGANELYNAITTYGKHVDEVQVTELDMLASKSYDGSAAQKETEQTKQAYRYKEIIDTVLKAKDEGVNITAVVFWGVSDDDSWLLSPEFSQGRHNMPLLFDENLKAKPAYWGITDPSKLLPNINEVDVLESAEKDWSLASPVNIGTDGNSSMKLLWNDGKLYLQVTVKDASNDPEDKVTVYLDKDNAKAENNSGVEVVTINRGEAVATADGYVVEKELDIPGKAANAKLGFDVVVYDKTAGVSQCWNDLQMKQEERSKYYGTLNLKPFMVISKGAADIDGEIDGAWNGITAHKLTVNSNPSVATTGTVKTMWDSGNLYVLAEIKDAVLNKDNVNSWEQDSFEIFVDENNGKTESYEGDDCQYRISYENEVSFNGQNCNASNIQSATKKTSDGYIVEARIKFNTVTGAENNLIGVDFQINDADASGARVATINWYDASGMGYAQPAVFGTARLSGSAGDRTGTDISTAQITGMKNYTYTGKAIEQDLIVEINGKQLSVNQDYTVSYKDNINAGTAEVTVSGNGDYTGSVTKQFKIKKAKQKIKVKKSSYKKKMGSKSFKLRGIKGTGKLSYKSSKKKVATVNKNGKVKIKGTGTTKITVTASGNKNYKKAKAVIKVKVVKKK